MRGASLLIAISLILNLDGPMAQTTGSNGLRLIAMDVGEGQAILLQREQHGFLVDTGHVGKALRVIHRLRDFGVERLDYITLTHLHPDHVSGYFRLREAFPNAYVLSHGLAFDETKVPDMTRWVSKALMIDTLRKVVYRGDKIEWRGITIKVIWPPPALQANLNDGSLVIEIIFGSRRALIMGDVGEKIEYELDQNQDLQGSYDVLVTGHHGSKGTSSDAFLSIVKPAYSIISTDVDNIRGYPEAGTVDRLERHSSSQLLKTYDLGDICLEWRNQDSEAELCSGLD